MAEAQRHYESSCRHVDFLASYRPDSMARSGNGRRDCAERIDDYVKPDTFPQLSIGEAVPVIDT